MQDLDSESLPPGWLWARLDEVCDICDYERVPVKREIREARCAGKLSRDLVPYYGATGQAGWIDAPRSSGSAILLGEDGAPFLDVGKPKAYRVSGSYWVNNHAHVLRPRDPRLEDIILHQLNIIDYTDFVSGTTRLKLTSESMRRIKLAIPPPKEAERVGNAIEVLFEEIEVCEAALARARESLTQFRASLLHAACTGALTADWRATNATNETGQALLQDVLAAREANRTTRNRPILEPDPAGLISLPQGWCWASVDQLTTFLGNGLARAPDGESTDRRILRISAVRPLNVNFAEHRFYRPLPSENLTGATTQRNDLLFTRYSGSEQYVGVCGLVRFDEPTLFPDKVMCARPLPNFPELAEYLQIALNAGPSRAYIAKNIRTTAGQKGIAGSSIRACPVPLPPRHEVIEIVRAYHDAHNGISELPTHEFALSLRQSILHAAFTGRLVPQDPTDEPAEALLARLRATPTAARRPRQRRGATQPDLIETEA